MSCGEIGKGHDVFPEFEEKRSWPTEKVNLRVNFPIGLSAQESK